MNIRSKSLVTAIALLILCALPATNAVAGEMPLMPAKERLQTADEHLNLSAEQKDAMMPLLAARHNVMRSARDMYAANPSKKTLREAYDLAKRGQKTFEKDAEKILTKEQMKTWKELRKKEEEMLKAWHKDARASL